MTNIPKRAADMNGPRLFSCADSGKVPAFQRGFMVTLPGVPWSWISPESADYTLGALPA